GSVPDRRPPGGRSGGRTGAPGAVLPSAVEAAGLGEEQGAGSRDQGAGSREQGAVRSAVQEAEAGGEGGSFAAAAHAQLVEDVANVVARGRFGDDEGFGDLAVGFATGDEDEHFTFARRD